MAIRILESSLAQRIAAGEVIERPCSVVRELTDNSIDAGAKNIAIYITDGGTAEISISDDGAGMSREDLDLACRHHATSKIAEFDDLYKIKTMGFRGEALCSIASCSRLTVTSRGYSKTVDNTREEATVKVNDNSTGTKITVRGLFDELPARKMFLKRFATEATMVKNTVIEKALAFPEIGFKLYSDSALKLDLRPETRKGRYCDCYAQDPSFYEKDTQEFEFESEYFKLYAVGTKHLCSRSDRSQIRIFVNGHCIDDFSIVQAVCAGYAEHFPGGRFPYFALFLSVDPTLVDFNIHPAKRECRIRIAAQLKSAVVSMIRDALKVERVQLKPDARGPEFKQNDLETLPGFRLPEKKLNTGTVASGQTAMPSPKFEPGWFERARQTIHTQKPLAVAQEQTVFAGPPEKNWRYIGRAFGLFLIVEKDGKLLFIDQHAAHERILYDEFIRDRKIERLLIPFSFEVEKETDKFLRENSFIYGDFGIELTSPKECVWEINTLPMISKGAETQIAKYIVENTLDIQEIEKTLFSTLACRAAIKAGDEVDKPGAEKLIEKVFALEKACCPHGRSFITEIDEKTLREAVGRLD